MSRSILLVPSVLKGNGSGHVVRCLSLARALGSGASVYLPEVRPSDSSLSVWHSAELTLAYARELSGLHIVHRLPAPSRRNPWELVILDRRATSAEELASWERFAPVVSIDEGGEARERAQYIVDILPRHPRAGGGEPNRSGLAFLDLPRARRAPPSEFRRLLLTFGGEDGAGLAHRMALLLLAEGLVEPSDLTIVTGALRRGAPPLGLDGVTVLGPVQDLKEHLARYDLVITQFGLTAFESAWAGCGVVLFNPSRYHRDLSRAAGFPEIGVLRPDIAALRRYLRSPSEVLAAVAGLVPKKPDSLADAISGLKPMGSVNCPACAGSSRWALYRNPTKSYFRCASCGAVYMVRFDGGREKPYEKKYFFEEYKNQYGKTYLEDWPVLTALAASRLDLVERIAGASLGRSEGLSILDVGCAYGPFLAAAKARGQDPYGLDISEEAVSYVRGELGIPAATGDFIERAVASAFGGPFDVLTMWYVIEHFERLDKALRNAAALIRPGGILALSTPSLEGASGRFDREGFFARSPEDHFTVWEPSRARGILKAYGFRVERIRITGHHPERLPGLRFLASRKGRGFFGEILAGLGSLASRIFALGDTFEIYAIRESVASQGSALGAMPDLKAERGAISGPEAN